MQSKSCPSIELNNGQKMPQVGLGTFLNAEGNVKDNVKTAILQQGYRHIDTAMIYKNEEQIGEALAECFAEGIKREDVFITTKLWADDKNDIEGALRTSLKKLQLEYIDQYLVHIPYPCVTGNLDDFTNAVPNHIVWKNMESLQKLGLTRSIGVSNYNA